MAVCCPVQRADLLSGPTCQNSSYPRVCVGLHQGATPSGQAGAELSHCGGGQVPKRSVSCK
ncbi:hypothetical protein BaRGS_00024863 [Batillaria attramentaria]|uniref:Uncharacterized protein n=1 Tax=Batillaria attramentaria TaxID=370345 RepID=A0ABD0KA82_9CAEN